MLLCGLLHPCGSIHLLWGVRWVGGQVGTGSPIVARLSVGTDWGIEERFQHFEVAAKLQRCFVCLRLTGHLSHTGHPSFS